MHAAPELLDTPRERRAGLPARLLALGALVGYAALLALARSAGRSAAIDLHFDDETVYLASGLRLAQQGFPSPAWAPLYAVWYWLEAHVVRDPIVLYYANWTALLFAVLLATALVVRAVGAGRLAIAAVLAITSILGIWESWTYVVLLSAALVGLGLAAALTRRSLVGGLSAAAVIDGIAAFVRPELLTSFVLLVVAVLVAGVAHRTRPRALAAAVGIPVAAFAALALWMGVPLERDRAITAFRQHYASNVASVRGLDSDPWYSANDVARRAFGDAPTPLAALRANPREFLWHVRRNLSILPGSVERLSPAVPHTKALRWVFLTLLAVGIALGAVRLVRAIRRRLPDERRTGVTLAVIAVATLAPAAISVAVVHPRDHYFVTPFIPVLAFAVWGWGLPFTAWRTGPAWRRLDASLAGATAVAFLAILPGRAGAGPWYRAAPASTPPNLALVRFLRTVPVPGARPVVLLEADRGRGIYAGWPSFQDLLAADCEPFRSCASVHPPDVISVDPRLLLHYRTAGDDGLAALVGAPSSGGYRRLEPPGADAVVLVRAGR